MKHHAMHTYRSVRAQLHVFLTLIPGGGEGQLDTAAALGESPRNRAERKLRAIVLLRTRIK